MKLIAILLSIIIMEAPSSMTSPGPFTSANALNTYSAKIYIPSALQVYTGSVESSDMTTGKRA